MENFYYKSPIGNLEIICEKNELISLKLTNKFKKSIFETDFINNIKINPTGTDFQKRVWKELQKIPYGEIKNYSNIAEIIGNKNAQRAVGNACNKNPIIIIIPCHRVTSKSGKIGGFAYGNTIKEQLLKIEKNIFNYGNL